MARDGSPARRRDRATLRAGRVDTQSEPSSIVVNRKGGFSMRSVCTAVVDRVADDFVRRMAEGPKTPKEMRSEFAALGDTVAGELRGPLARRVEQRLLADPTKDWIAPAIGLGPRTRHELRSLLEGVEAQNRRIHDDDVVRGRYVVFAKDDGKSIHDRVSQ